MKRIICILMASILLFLCGCSTVVNKTAGTDSSSRLEDVFDENSRGNFKNLVMQNKFPNNALTKADIDLMLKRGDYANVPTGFFGDPFEGRQTEVVTETETTVAETEPITETEPPAIEAPVTVPPVTDAAPAPEPIPVDYSNLPMMYGFYPDIIPDRTWSAVKAPSANSQTIDPSKPMLALTFDDGPSIHTDRLLNIFQTYGGKGTFFVVGNLIGGREATLKRIADEGHEIGGHSWNHSNLTHLSEQGIVDQIMMTRAKIYAVTGSDCHIMRPPYGAHNDMLRWTAAKLGVGLVNWSVDTLDWKTKNADAVYNEVISRATDGAVILCHDLHGTTVDAMERAIPALIDAGYQLVTVSEMMMYSGNAFQAGNMYYKK